MYGVFFRAGGLAFVDLEEFGTAEVKRWKASVDAAEELRRAAEGVDLKGAPLASWVLARLAGMSESTLFPADFVRKEGELGGFRVRMLAVRGMDPLAKLRVAAECGKAELSATAATAEDASAAARALIDALVAEPRELGRIQIAVKAAELGNHRNEYGFDGVELLGRHNVTD